MAHNEDIPEDEFSSDEEFDDEEEDSESSTDVDAKLAEDEVFDEEFLKCYAALKKRDEKIYDTNVRFFSEKEESKSKTKNDTEELDKLGKPKAPKMTLIDHQLALARGEIEDPSLLANTNRNAPTSHYEKELEEIKTSIQKQSENIDSDSEDDLLLVKGSKDGEAPSKLRKRPDSLLDKIEDPDVAHLKELWNNPEQLAEEDKFLRDFIVNKRYLPSNVQAADGSNAYFSKNIDELSDAEDEESANQKKRVYKVDEHSDIARVPRNSTKTIRDLVEKQKKKEKRLKKVEKKKKKKMKLKDADYEDIIDDLPIKFHYQETEPQDNGLTAEELLIMSDDEDLDAQTKKTKSKKQNKKHVSVEEDADGGDATATEPESKTSKRKKKHKRGLNHKKFAKVGVAPDRLLAYGLSKNKLKKSKLL